MRKVLIILFFAINSVLSATNYYVKNGGNDAASGISDATAWANHPWMSTWKGNTKLVAGDNVFMKRGDSWSIAAPSAPYMTVSQSGRAGSYITTTAYGTGNKPIIHISTNSAYPIIYGIGESFIVFDNLEIKHWSSSMDPGWYYCILFGHVGSKISHDWIITNCDIHNCPNIGIYGGANSFNITIGDISATTIATPTTYSNHIYDCGYAGIGLGGCDPLTKNSNFYVFQNYIHDINVGGANAENAYGIFFNTNSTSYGIPRYCYARYNCVKNIPTWEGLDCHNGQYMYFQDNYVYNCHASFGAQSRTYGPIAPLLDNLYIERNIFENPADDIYTNFYFTQVSGESTTATGMVTNAYIRNNRYFYSVRPTDESGAYGIKISNIDGIIIDGNYFYNGPSGLCYGAVQMNTYEKNVTISNNFIDNWHYSIVLNPSSVQGNINIYNNIIHSQGVAIGTADEAGNTSGDINLYNNVIIISPTTLYSQPINFNNTTIPIGSSLKIKNNIIGFTTGYSKSYVYGPSTINGTFEIDYNIYWNSLATSPYFGRGIFYAWAGWNTLGYDTHSLNNTDPLFMNKSGSYSESLDFALKSTSLAINKGTVLSEVTHDFFGNTRDATPDIGAYEYLVPVTGITVTAGSNTITNDKGTLQLSAAVSPSNATNKTITWTIANGTSQAAISSAGLVSATGNGTVTARATASDGSGVYGTLSITISNQVIPDSLVLVNSVIENSTPAVLEVVYNITVADVVPSTSAFTVIVNSAASNINTMIISGTKVLLTLASPVVNGDIITVAYNKPSTNPLQAASGGQAASISAQPVINKVTTTSYEQQQVKIYPNPAHEFINIRIVELTLVLDFIRIINLSGKVVFLDKLIPDIKDFQIPLNLIQGVYIVQIGSGKQTLFAQKLIVGK